MRKYTIIMLITCLAASSLLMILPASLAQTTKPATPTFTIEYSDNEILLKITNQPFTPYTENGLTVNLYYEAQVKRQGAVDSLWTSANPSPTPYVLQTDSQYTIIPIGVGHNADVRVRAVVGTVIDIPYNPDAPYSARCEFKGVEGDWSHTQTVTLNRPTFSSPSSTSPANTNPSTPFPSQFEPDFDVKPVWSIFGAVLLAVIALAVVVVLVVVGIIVLLLRKK
jgi:hypothetical protein